MRFHRTGRVTITGINNRRLAHARKAVQRDKDSWALFPEYVKHETPEQRIADIDTGKLQWERDQRQAMAEKWRQTRARLAAFAEPMRSRLLAYWNSRTMLPGHPAYLAGLLYDAEIGRFDPEKANREMERCRMLGIISSQVGSEVAVPAWPWPKSANREVCFLSLHVAREIAQARAPYLFPPLSERAEFCDPEADAFQSITPVRL